MHRIPLGHLVVPNIHTVGDLQYYPEKVVSPTFGSPHKVQQRCSIRAYVPQHGMSILLDLTAWADLVDPLLERVIANRAFNAVLSPIVTSGPGVGPDGKRIQKIRYTIIKFI